MSTEEQPGSTVDTPDTHALATSNETGPSSGAGDSQEVAGPQQGIEAVGDSKEELTEKKSQNAGMYDLEPSDDTGFRMGTEEQIDPAVVKLLTDGFVEHILPSLEKSQSSINEILSNQMVLLETMEQENGKFKECTAFKDLCDMMGKAREYQSKLVVLKRDMVSLHDRAGKLKRRALKLQQQKQKEELQRAHQQERELEKEQMLTARVARPDT